MADPFKKKGESYTADIVWNGYDANLQPEVVEVLNRAQQLVDFPITLNSGYRSPARNARAGGAKKSQHMLGKAVDVSVKGLSNQQRTQLTRALVQSGGKRLGAYSGNTAIHLDMASGYKTPKGYNAYPMFDRRAANMDRAPAWFKSGLTGKIPPANIPSVASALNTFAAPVPASLSSYVSTQRNPPPLPRARPNQPTRTASLNPSQPVPSAPDWMRDYGRVLQGYRPNSSPVPGMPSGDRMSPQYASRFYDDVRLPKALPPGTTQSTRGPGYKSTDQRFAATTGGANGRVLAGAGSQASGSLSLPPRPASAEARVTARNRSALDIPASRPQPISEIATKRVAEAGKPLAIPRTLAEDIWETTSFGSPRTLPGVDMGSFAEMQAKMAKMPPMPRPRPQLPGPQFQPITVRGGNRPAPVSMPRPNRNVATPAAASNGYVYAVNPQGGAPVRIGTTRPAGMTAAQDYDRRAAAARASSPDNGGNPSWW